MGGFLRGFSSFGGILILGIGLAMLGVTIYAFVHSQLLFNKYTLLSILLASDVIIILASVIGIIGIKRSNGFMICVFQIMVMIFLLSFLGIGIAAQVLPKTLFEGNCSSSNNQLIEITNDSYNMSLALCTPACPCGLTDDAINNGGYSTVQKGILKVLNRQANKPVRFQDCSIAKEANQTYQDMFNVLGSVQQAFDCSGWCSNIANSLFYKFSNVNRGKPATACYDTMKQNLSKYGNVIGISAFIASLFLMLVCMTNLVICCAPERRNLEFKDRFVVNEEGYYRQAD